MSAYEFKQLSTGFAVAGNFPKQYGLVVRGGKRFFRNYHRELKNGNGLTWLDVLEAHSRNVYAQMAKLTAINVFHTGE